MMRMVTSPPPGRAARAMLLDVEGTTTPVAFVYDVLFPYARQRLRRSLGAAPPPLLAAFAAEHGLEAPADGLPPWDAARPGLSALAYARWLMERDRKSTALKALQGVIWDAGFASGELRGQVYDDVPPALRRWSGEGRPVAIFSSGSTLAQRRIFGTTAWGDLTPLLSGFFDTTTGAKQDPASYRAIAEALGHTCAEMLFVSDVVGELRAAREAGAATALCVRDGQAGPPAEGHPVIRSFDQLG
jgi:enolase-phosphatase E1